MASNTINNFFTEGSIFGVTFYVRDGRVIARPAHNLVSKGPKTLGQLEVMTRWGGIINSWKVLAELSRSTMTERRRGESAYNKFVSENFPVSSAHLTKQEVSRGGCVLEDFVVSTGSADKVPTVEVQTVGQRHVSDILLRHIQLDEDTTVGEFTQAVCLSNPQFAKGDNLVFLRLTQRWDETNERPYFTTYYFRLTLDAADSRKLRAIVGTDGYILTQATIGQRTGSFLSAEVQEGTKVTYIHERRVGDRVCCSRQQVTGPNPMAQAYTTPEAFAKAVRSYGGMKDPNFFDPSVQSVTYEDIYGDPGSGGGSTPTPTPVKVTVSVVITGENASRGTVSPESVTVDRGSQVTFTASAQTGYKPKWPDNSNSATYTVTANESHNIALQFIADGGLSVKEA